MLIVNLRHPGYDDDNNTLLTLQAPDDPYGGIHHETARIACCILAGNRWDGYLSITQSQPKPVVPDDGILRRRDYYFFLPDYDTPEDVSDLRGAKSGPYPITPRFRDWSFPTGNLPPIWELASFAATNGADHDHKSSNQASEACRLCGKLENSALVSIWPKIEGAIFDTKVLDYTIYTDLFDPDADSKAPDQVNKYFDDRNFLRLGTDCGIEQNNVDCIEAYNNQQIVFVPKFEADGLPVISAHRFAPVRDGYEQAHNKPLLRPHEASIEFLFTRFAWATIMRLGRFLESDVPRVLCLADTMDRKVLVEAEPGLCKILASQSTTDWPSEGDEASDTNEQQPEEVNENASDGMIMVPEYAQRLRHHALCDICEDTVYGFRYKCLDCDDFDLDTKCFELLKHDPSHHLVLIDEAPWRENVKTGRLVPKETVDDDEIEDVQETFEQEELGDRAANFVDLESPYETKLPYNKLPEPKEGQVWIRILNLWPGDDDEPILAHIETCQLQSADAFEALSYCWGDPATDHTVSVSGHQLGVTRNLKVALMYLRRPKRVRRIWIDAICINQNDPVERAQQVTIMRDIYEQAFQTIVWLGEKSVDSEKAISLCKRLFVDYGNSYFREIFNVDYEELYREQFRLGYNMRRQFDKDMARLRHQTGMDADEWEQSDEFIAAKSELDRKVQQASDASEAKLLSTVKYTGAQFSGQMSLASKEDDSHDSGEDDPADLISEYDSDGEESVQSESSSKKTTVNIFERMALTIMQRNKNKKKTEGPREIEEGEVEALHNLLSRPWFSRVWIVQEAGMTKKCLFRCGSRKIDWWVLQMGFYICVSLNKRLAASNRSLRHVLHLSETRMRLSDNIVEDKQEKLDLLHLLRCYRQHSATDARDKIYALLGIASSSLKEQGFVPDYLRSVGETYRQLAIAMLNQSKRLDILTMSRSTESVTTPASWIPDWRDKASQPWPLVDSPLSDENLPLGRARNTFTASKGSTLSTPVIIKDNTRLCLEGYVVDEVETAGSAMKFLDSFEEFWKTYRHFMSVGSIEGIWDLVDAVRNAFSGLKVYTEWESLVGIDKPGDQPAVLEDVKKDDKLFTFIRTIMVNSGVETLFDKFWEYRVFVHKFCAALDQMPGKEPIDLNDGDAVTEYLGRLSAPIVALGDNSKRPNQRGAEAVSYIYGRRLIISKEGRMGLACINARAGDQIVLLRGGSVPFVVRPRSQDEGVFELVGDMYLEGGMYGELWDEDRCKAVELV